MTKHFNPSSIASGTVANSALVVWLTISQWSGRRLDRKVTDEVNQNHGASEDASRVNKLLVPKDALTGVNSVVSQTRTGFASRTLPWTDTNGERIVASAKLFDLRNWVVGQRAKYEKAVDDFLAGYPNLVAQAPARLGSMFNASDFPSADELRGRYAMVMDLRNVESGNDLRISISEDQRSLLAGEIEDRVRAQVGDAMSDAYRRVAEATERMVEKLSAYKPAEKKGDRSEGVFRDSLVGNIRDLIEAMPSLNITGDPRLAALAEELKKLTAHEASDLRENERLRQETAAEAQRILDHMGEWF